MPIGFLVYSSLTWFSFSWHTNSWKESIEVYCFLNSNVKSSLVQRSRAVQEVLSSPAPNGLTVQTVHVVPWCCMKSFTLWLHQALRDLLLSQCILITLYPSLYNVINLKWKIFYWDLALKFSFLRKFWGKSWQSSFPWTNVNWLTCQ